MLQAFVPEVGKIEYREVDMPVIRPDQILIRVSCVGICGSDQHVFHGMHPLVRPPLVQGHEFSGVIEDIGSEVEGLSSGNLVTVQPAGGCGDCANCRDDLPGQCANMKFVGGNVVGAMSSHIAVDARQVYLLPEGTKPQDAAMAEPLAVAIRAVNMAGAVLNDAPVFVAGGGTIGQLVARVALLSGAKRVVVSDPNPHRRACAEAAGCQSLDPGQVDGFGQELSRLCEGEAVGVAIECVGSTPAFANCLEAVSRRGQVIVCGVFGQPAVIDMVKVQDQEIAVRGSLMYSWAEFGAAVAMIAGGKIQFGPIQTHHVSFENIEDAYTMLEQQNTDAIKVFVDVE